MSAYLVGLEPRIRDILSSSDLASISAKGVRKQLIAGGEDEAVIKANRDAIDQIIGDIYEELAGDIDEVEEGEEENGKPLFNNSQSAHPPPSSQPKPLSNRSLTQSQIVKSESESKPKAQVESDEQLARRLQAEYESAAGGRSRRSTAAPVKKKKKTSSSVKKRSTEIVDGDDDGQGSNKKRKGGGGGTFNKELILSDALAGLVGEERLSRPQTVKRIWDYVKLHGLQDQSDKRFILCDDNMRSVFHSDRLHMFTMNKLLVQHFRDPDEVI